MRPSLHDCFAQVRPLPGTFRSQQHFARRMLLPVAEEARAQLAQGLSRLRPASFRRLAVAELQPAAQQPGGLSLLRFAVAGRMGLGHPCEEEEEAAGKDMAAWCCTHT